MKNLIFTCVFCIICTSVSMFAQKPIDVIEFKNLLGGKNFVYAQDSKGLRTKDLLKIMESNQEAYQQMRTAKRNYTLSTLTYLGGLGITLYTSLSDTYTESGKLRDHRALQITAMGLLISCYPLFISSKKQKRNAVRIYNEGLKSTETGMNKFRPQLGFADRGLGLKVSF